MPLISFCLAISDATPAESTASCMPATTTARFLVCTRLATRVLVLASNDVVSSPSTCAEAASGVASVSVCHSCLVAVTFTPPPLMFEQNGVFSGATRSMRFERSSLLPATPAGTIVFVGAAILISPVDS